MKPVNRYKNSIGHENILALDVGEHVIGVALYLVHASAHLDATAMPSAVGDSLSHRESSEAVFNSISQVKQTTTEPTQSQTLSQPLVAIPTAQQGVSLPLTPIVREEGSLALGILKRMVKRFKPQSIVIGLPKLPLENNGRSQQKHNLKNFKKIKAYSAKLRRHFPRLNIITLDEAYTTWVVKQRFPNIQKQPTATGIDSLSALEILKSYLNQHVHEDC